MNVENLEKLARYLLQPRLKAQFDMGRFDSKGITSFVPEGTCGTAGCAIGHGPYAGLPKDSLENWYLYSERVFGLSFLSKEWQWMFSSFWDQVDNTPEGAAKRILCLTRGDGLPFNFKKESLEKYNVDDYLEPEVITKFLAEDSLKLTEENKEN